MQSHGLDYVYFRGPVKPTAARIFRPADPHRPASDHPFVSADVEMHIAGSTLDS